MRNSSPSRWRAAALALGLCSTLAVAAMPPLVPINTPASAARGVLLTLNSYNYAARPLDALLTDSRLIWLRTLGWINSATTPAALANSRGGIAIACPLGGNMLARLAKSGKRVLRVTWTGCAFLDGNRRTVYDGPGEVVLPSDTFTPDHLKALHLGNADVHFKASYTLEDSPPGDIAVSDLDLHVAGCIPLTRFLNVGIFTGQYDVTINGTLDNHFTFSNPDDPTQPPFQSDSWQEAVDFRAVGATTHSEENTVLEEDFTILRGTYRQIGATVGKPPVETWATTSARNFHGRRVLRVRDSTSSVSADGLLHLKNVVGAPCTDGWYSFRTRVPIRQYNVFRYDGKDAGDVSVNGARITFSLTDPIPPPPWYTPGPDEKPTRVLVDMGSAGTFEHVSYLVGATIQDFSQCTN
jgi:hypothetical protein